MASIVVLCFLVWCANTSSMTLAVIFGREIAVWQWRVLQSLLVAFCWHLLYGFILYPAFFSPFKHLPTPSRRSWLTGNEYGLFREPQWIVARRVSETVTNDGLLRYYAALSQERLLVTSPQGLAEILVQKVDDYDHPIFMKFAAGRITGAGLQFINGEEHKHQRKHLMPAFGPVHVKTLVPTFWHHTQKMINGIEREMQQSANPNHAVFITDWSIRVSLDIIGTAGMGFEFDAVDNPEGEHRTLTKVYREFMSRSSRVFPWLGLLMNYIPPSILEHVPEQRNLALSRAFLDVRDRAKNIIEARKEKMQFDQEQGQSEGKDIITVALASGMFSSANLLDHVMTSLVVGHLSTAITFDWVCFELGQRPDMQARLREEIRTRLPGGLAEKPDASRLESLEFLNAICSETLRYYPPLAFALRVAVRDTTILGTKVPKGTTVAYCADAINHDKTLWGEDAHKFNPERWMGPGRAASGGARNNYSMMTFSAGPKNCIGQWWERVELACLVAAVFGAFEVELANVNTAAFMERAPVLMSREGIYIRMRRVPGW